MKKGSIELDESEEEYVAKDEVLVDKNEYLKKNVRKRKVASMLPSKSTIPDTEQTPAYYCPICKISLC